MILAKNFSLSSNNVHYVQILMESDNVFNHTQFLNPIATYTSANFGDISRLNRSDSSPRPRERCVNITLGLPVIRTSVDHGTAFDIAGTGKADERSMVEAIHQAAQLAERAI